jgi:hypothetical protein
MFSRTRKTPQSIGLPPQQSQKPTPGGHLKFGGKEEIREREQTPSLGPQKRSAQEEDKIRIESENDARDKKERKRKGESSKTNDEK